MAHETRGYLLPLVGTMLDWETLSGDPTDPVRPLGPHEVEATLPTSAQGIRVQLRSVDPEAGTCEVDIEASTEFHDALAVFLKNKVSEEAAQVFGRTLCRKPQRSPEPRVNLRFGA